MKTEKLVLTLACALAGAWTVRMLVGIVGLSRTQDIAVLAAVFEVSVFFCAALLPLVAVWFLEERKRKWLYVLWAPCVLYVSFLAFRYLLVSPLAGGVRLLIWSVITVLFIRESKKSKPA